MVRGRRNNELINRTAATSAALRYADDSRPGLRRARAGKGFVYLRPDGKRVRDPATLLRIRKLAIPPAWKDVWICPAENGHLQATGRDARGRKQYRYHERWREVRDETKFGRMLEFAAVLPKLREQVDKDQRLSGMDRRRVLATVVWLLETTLIRVGNEEYARDNHSYGLTTLENEHARVKGDAVRFRFRGKSGKVHDVGIQDRRVAKTVRRCQDLPGHDLFGYIDEVGKVRDVTSEDVNEYLREVTGEEFTAKDFRTWAGTLLAAQFLCEQANCSSSGQVKKMLVEAAKNVAEHLGNTPAVCRKSYIHPAVLDAFADGVLVDSMKLAARRARKGRRSGLGAEEVGLVRLLTKAAKAK